MAGLTFICGSVSKILLWTRWFAFLIYWQILISWRFKRPCLTNTNAIDSLQISSCVASDTSLNGTDVTAFQASEATSLTKSSILILVKLWWAFAISYSISVWIIELSVERRITRFTIHRARRDAAQARRMARSTLLVNPIIICSIRTIAFCWWAVKDS